MGDITRNVEDKHISEAVLLAVYAEHHSNFRAFMDMRFKHFTTYMVVTGLLGAGLFNPTLNFGLTFRVLLCLSGIVMTFPFWVIDHHCKQHYHHQLLCARKCHAELKILPMPDWPSGPIKGLGGSEAALLIFVVAGAVWSGYLAYLLYSWPSGASLGLGPS